MALESQSKDADAIDAFHAINSVIHQLAMKLIVLDMALQESILSMPSDQKDRFLANFKARAELVMHDHSTNLVPRDDAAISLEIARILKTALPR